MKVNDAWSVPISALQHYLYCPRQCALIHLEQVWSDDARTAEGRLLHQKVDRPGATSRRTVQTVTALPLEHPGLGIHGVADVVEFSGSGDQRRAMPVEYKRGRPKKHRADEVQLCAQAMCLEHMLDQPVLNGALFYGELRRRQAIEFDEALRVLTHQTISAVRTMLESHKTPTARYEAARCDRCSLLEDCRPRLLGRDESVMGWLRAQMRN